MVRLLVAVLALSLGAVAVPAQGQTPVPFPKPGQPTTPQKPPATPQQPPPTPAPPSAQAQPAQAEEAAPSEATLGVPIYPGAQYLKSFAAGMGQRYYLFGTNSAFADIVAYYRTALKQKGDLVFEEPPVHEFDLARFREETMAFPPSVTVKDYAWGGSQGYLNPKRGAPAERFKTIIQIVPVIPGTPK